MPEISIRCVTGEGILPYLQDLARLRIEVFREFPYLYDGNESYEQKYLQTYAQSANALFVLALSGEQIVGASSALPLIDEGEAMTTLFERQGMHPSQVLYFGESVLLSSFRGTGIGKRFMEERERHAQALQKRICSFCAVIRAENHSLQPANYQTLHGFWNKMGYSPVEGMIMDFHWKDIDQEMETAKSMQFWAKSLA
jgi:GNAT superfamily N-acetyltransferase